MYLSEHNILIALAVALLAVLVRAHFERKHYLNTTIQIQQASIALVAPLRDQTTRTEQRVAECLNRVERLEESLARFTAGWDMVELWLKRQKLDPPWRPLDKDKVYLGRNRDTFI